MADDPPNGYVDDRVPADFAEAWEQWKSSLPAKLEEIRVEWERSRHTNLALLWASLNMIKGILPPPPWLVEAISEQLMKLIRPTLWKKNERRWVWVRHFHYDLGLSLSEACDRVSKMLEGTNDAGTPLTIRRAYFEFKKDEKAKAAGLFPFPKEEWLAMYSGAKLDPFEGWTPPPRKPKRKRDKTPT
jgi:hypothetical protein